MNHGSECGTWCPSSGLALGARVSGGTQLWTLLRAPDGSLRVLIYVIHIKTRDIKHKTPFLTAIPLGRHNFTVFLSTFTYWFGFNQHTC